jgi:hypothetical protein
MSTGDQGQRDDRGARDQAAVDPGDRVPERRRSRVPRTPVPARSEAHALG